MKKLFYLLNGLLLTAALAACSSDYDDPPEQPNSHQNEVSVDSVEITPEEGASKDYTVISTVPVSQEVKAFFDEALPLYYYERPSDFIIDWKDEANPAIHLINSKEEFVSRYIGTSQLPNIDFNTHTLLIGMTLFVHTHYLDYLEIFSYKDKNELIIHTQLPEYAVSGLVPIRFWGLFPKIEGTITVIQEIGQINNKI